MVKTDKKLYNKVGDISLIAVPNRSLRMTYSVIVCRRVPEEETIIPIRCKVSIKDDCEILTAESKKIRSMFRRLALLQKSMCRNAYIDEIIKTYLSNQDLLELSVTTVPDDIEVNMEVVNALIEKNE